MTAGHEGRGPDAAATEADVLARDPYVSAYPEHLSFWQAAVDGRLLLPRCTACGETHWHPRPHCPFCRSSAVRWEASDGRARLHTYTIIPRTDGQTVLAYVQIENGPLMLTNIIEADVAALSIDMPLEVAFRSTAEGRAAPVFRPARGPR